MTKVFFSFINFARRSVQRLLGASTVGVKGFVVNAENEVLLVEHTYISGWHLPGGGLERGEHPLDALKRELHEEAGIKVKGSPLLFAIYAHLIHGAQDFPILYVVLDFETTTAPLCPEIKQARWFHYQQLPPGTTSHTQRRINEYFQQSSRESRW
jgi:8-oxo-dGTP pyrophosphatase MutT (NUDIX family)